MRVSDGGALEVRRQVRQFELRSKGFNPCGPRCMRLLGKGREFSKRVANGNRPAHESCRPSRASPRLEMSERTEAEVVGHDVRPREKRHNARHDEERQIDRKPPPVMTLRRGQHAVQRCPCDGGLQGRWNQCRGVGRVAQGPESTLFLDRLGQPADHRVTPPCESARALAHSRRIHKTAPFHACGVHPSAHTPRIELERDVVRLGRFAVQLILASAEWKKVDQHPVTGAHAAENAKFRCTGPAAPPVPTP